MLRFDAAQLGAFQQGIQQFWRESSFLRSTSNLIEHLLERRVFACGQLPHPKTQQGLNLALFLGSSGVVGPRCLWVQRNRDGRIRHEAHLPPFYGKNAPLTTPLPLCFVSLPTPHCHYSLPLHSTARRNPCGWRTRLLGPLVATSTGKGIAVASPSQPNLPIPARTRTSTPTSTPIRTPIQTQMPTPTQIRTRRRTRIPTPPILGASRSRSPTPTGNRHDSIYWSLEPKNARRTQPGIIQPNRWEGEVGCAPNPCRYGNYEERWEKSPSARCSRSGQNFLAGNFGAEGGMSSSRADRKFWCGRQELNLQGLSATRS